MIASYIMSLKKNNLSPNIVIFYTFLITTIFFNIINFSYLKKMKENIEDITKLNTTTAVSWIFGIYALLFIDPEVMVVAAISIGPLDK